MLFLRKTDETIWKPPLSTNAPISEQFFHDSPSCPNFKSEISPPPDFREGGGLRLSEVMDGNRLN